MMVYYNLSFAESSDLYTITSGLNTQVDGLLAGLLLLSIYLILYIAMKQYDVKVVMLTTSFIVSIIAVLFWTLGFIGVNIVIIPLILLFAAILIKVFGDG